MQSMVHNPGSLWNIRYAIAADKNVGRRTIFLDIIYLAGGVKNLPYIDKLSYISTSSYTFDKLLYTIKLLYIDNLVKYRQMVHTWEFTTLYLPSEATQHNRFSQSQEFRDRALHFLYDEYNSRVAASDIFPPQISAADIRKSIDRYKDEMTATTREVFVPPVARLLLLNIFSEINQDDPILLH